MPGSLVGEVITLRPEGDPVDIYRSEHGHTAVQAWCLGELNRRLPTADRRVVDTPLGPTHLTTSGCGPQELVWLPGTNLNAATSIPLIRALAGSFRVTVADLPGQPGLSTAERPETDLVDRYQAWVDQVLASVGDGPVLLAGESRGATVALCASRTPRIGGLLLAAPAGLIDAPIFTSTPWASLAWRLHPSPTRAARMLTTLYGDGVVADHDQLTDWMTLLARHTHTNPPPTPLPDRVVIRWRAKPCHVLVGEHDRFLAPRHLQPTAARMLHAPTTVVPGGGHLLSHTSPAAVTDAASWVLGSVHVRESQ